MIQLEASGEILDLYPDTSVELELINPAFTTADEGGSFGYPFDLPGTTTNHRITGHAYMLEKRDVLNISIPYRLDLFGLGVSNGILKLTYPVSREKIRAFLVVNTFADTIKNKNIRSVSYPDREDFADLSALAAAMDAAETPLSKEYAFFPSLLSISDVFIQNEYSSGFTASSLGYLTAVPHPYAYDVLRRIAHHYGYTIFDELFSSADDLRQIVLYHHRAVQKDKDTNDYYIDLAESVPDVSISVFLRAICSMFNAAIYTDDRRKNIKIVPLINLLSNGWVEWTSKAEPRHEVTPLDDNGYTLQWAWTSGDKLHETYFAAQFKASLRYLVANAYYRWENERSVKKVEELNDVVMPAAYDTYWVEEANAFYWRDGSVWQRLAWSDEGTVADISLVASPVENGVYFSEVDDQYMLYIKQDYPFTLPVTPTWRHFAYRKNEDFVVGNGGTIKTSTAHPTEMHTKYTTAFVLTIPMPSDYFLEAAGEFVRKDVEADKSIRLLIYRGLDATVYPGYRYPFATPDVYDTRGVPVGTHSLRWDGEFGLYEKFWKLWLDFLGSTRKVTRSLRLTAADIFNLDLTQQVRIENINYLIGKINVAITMQGISLARAELYTVGTGTEGTMSGTSGEAPNRGIGWMTIGSTNIVG